MRIVSVDPGLKGALTLLEGGQLVEVEDMPICKIGSKNLLDFAKISGILDRWQPDQAAVEKVGSSPRMGVSSAFNFGLGYGGLLGVLAGMQLPYETITPQRWKTYHGLIQKGKDASRKKAMEIFPEQKEYFKLAKHDGRADAVLIGLAWEAMNKK